jgi:hypothetical protein
VIAGVRRTRFELTVAEPGTVAIVLAGLLSVGAAAVWPIA